VSAFFSSIVCIVVSISLLYADTIIYADSTSVQHESDQGTENYEEGSKSLHEENNDGKPIPPSYYELYPESDEFDIFDDEDEASYCS
jgi:hypothetical protein